MATNNSRQEWAAEIRATAEASAIVRALDSLTSEPSTKRFVKSRATRIERWRQLAECAERQASGLAVLAKTSPRPKAKARTDVPITVADGQPTAQQSA